MRLQKLVVFAAAMMVALPAAPTEARVTRHHAVRHHAVHHRHHRRRPHLLPVSANAPNAELVFDASTGRVLAVENPDQQVYPASLTKMMTLYLAFRAIEAGRLRLDDMVEVSSHAAAAPPTKLGLREGQTVLVDELIRGAVTESANDAARVLAERLDGSLGHDLLQMLRADLAQQEADDAADAQDNPQSPQDAADRAQEVAYMHTLANTIVADGSEEDFARIMTLQARLLGMDDTTYRNASGLPDMEQVTTAPDYAMLAYAIVNLPARYYSYFSVQHFQFGGADHHNHNLNFLTHYDGADGIKTGYTQSGGFNVVDSARRGGTRLVAIVMGRHSLAAREAEVNTLLDAGFAATHGATVVSVASAPDVLSVGQTLDFPTLPELTPSTHATPLPADLAASLEQTSAQHAVSPASAHALR
ncbi:MAG TPA: D-alanyl-D-alanine carboxypeptidase family protein [Vitreimonas sp.]|nr:D-alanyl-D-alanine carboxypeptidase family protein [Vitreimonas sp.]